MNLSKALPATILIILSILILESSAFGLKERREISKKEEEVRTLLEEKNYLTGKFNPSERADFALVPRKNTIDGSENMYLRKETLSAFLLMSEAARRDSVDIKIASATRNFDHQKNLWNTQWSGAVSVGGKNLSKSFPKSFDRFKKILEYVAVPGTSRHHWGTDIDINGANAHYFDSNRGVREYQWLVKNAMAFGFCQTYRLRQVDARTGYNEEKWHWSYIPLSRGFTAEYGRLIKNEDISGFFGDEFVVNQDMVHQYALSINPNCL